jgi:hypothetical protein
LLPIRPKWSQHEGFRLWEGLSRPYQRFVLDASLLDASPVASWVARLAGPAARSGPIAIRRESACPMEAVSANFLTAVELWWMIEANTCKIQQPIGIKNEELGIISNE